MWYLLLTLNIAYARLFLPGIMDYFACDHIHIVQPGDSCLSISKLYDIKLNFLLWKNKKLNCSKIEHGSKLCVNKWI